MIAGKNRICVVGSFTFVDDDRENLIIQATFIRQHVESTGWDGAHYSQLEGFVFGASVEP